MSKQCCGVPTGWTDEHTKEFEKYKEEHKKTYKDAEEEAMRKGIWLKTDEFIKAHNATESPYNVGHNFMSDWTEEEKSRMCGLKTPQN